MYGYLIPFKPDLMVKEEKLYKAFYCGLCRYLKQNYGGISRLTVQYDMAVLALFINEFLEDKPTVRMKYCVANPLQKHPEIYSCQSLDIISSLNVIMFYRKLSDDIKDNGRFISRPARLALYFANKKAEKRIGKPIVKIDNYLDELNKLEQNRCTNMDEPAHLFGEVLKSFIDCFDGLDIKLRPIIENFCYNIGKWVYLVDAIDDYDKDIISGNYNPLIFSDYEKEEAIFIASESCRWASGQAAAMLDLLPVHDNMGIMENILYIGMPATLDKILNGKGDNEELL